ncbi:hypothetical protein GCM10011289_24160 [Paludibacterium paludis]|uniref:Bacterial transcription activator effector binding domain-containing protein n=2 Tax=Paludibacterium paludis TaxID=1225769 RepID=A0A918P4V9_9NEIS|nr:hypothetical protein GCM10011289_24160 [Paludibacterium paludis]
MHQKVVEPLTVLYAAQELTIPEIGSHAEKLCAALLAEAQKQRLSIAGPWVFVYHKLPANGTDRCLAEFCLPVDGPETGSDSAFAVKTLNRFACAASEYRGSLAGLFEHGYQPLVNDITGAGLRVTGESREIYHAWAAPDSPDNRVELQFGVE